MDNNANEELEIELEKTTMEIENEDQASNQQTESKNP